MSERSQRGGGSGCLWFLAGALAFGFLLSQTANDATGSGGSTGPQSQSTASPTAPDATAQALLSVGTGSCLRNYYGGFGWGDQLPEVTDCERVDAFYTVTDGGIAPRCASDGSSTEWSHYSDYHRDHVALCLSRRYRAEQCFPGQPDGSGEVVSARLDTVWPCDTDDVPEEGDQILRITGYYSSPADPDDRVCTGDPADTTYYYVWGVHGGEEFICAVITD
ncbi:hypothetical protein [Streptomyces sp. B6B3]|uniref:hypothetical protein n=1 Tax=Streptomyces sp. B6B3 TaxID=3153570 RepID=UPI00325EEE39